METISINGKEAKKHIMTAMKAVFPSVKFSFKSDFDTVSVNWTDGPLREDVQKVMNRFASYTYVRARNDRHDLTGYEWKGDLYKGPRYLNVNRTLTDERRTALMVYMEKGEKTYNDAFVFERTQAERDLISMGLLVGIAPQDLPELMRNEAPELDIREQEKVEADAKEAAKKVRLEAEQTNQVPAAVESKQLAKVYPFPVQKLGSDEAADQFYEALDPEQKLKVEALKLLFKVGPKEILQSGLSVDAAFSFAAIEFIK